MWDILTLNISSLNLLHPDSFVKSDLWKRKEAHSDRSSPWCCFPAEPRMHLSGTTVNVATTGCNYLTDKPSK